MKVNMKLYVTYIQKQPHIVCRDKRNLLRYLVLLSHQIDAAIITAAMALPYRKITQVNLSAFVHQPVS